jgi:hypothetical protein
MATIRKRGAKWQVQIRGVGVRPISRSFHVCKDAEAWARQIEFKLTGVSCQVTPRHFDG